MKTPLTLIAFLASTITFAAGANILALLTIASPSHHIWNSPLLVALANRGHNVTIVSPQGHKKPVPNLTDLVVPGAVEEVAENYDYTAMSEVTTTEWIKEVFVFSFEGCRIVLQSDAFKQLMNYPPETKFDLVFIEAFGCECLFGALHKFGNPPIIAMNAFSVPFWTMKQTGTPSFPSHMPFLLTTYTDHMTFTERLMNVLYYIYGNYIYHNEFIPKMDKLAKNYFKEPIPPVAHYLDKISLVLANFHPSLDYPWATSPNLIPVEGIQVKDPSPLPTDLQKYLDEAKHGVIFFSLGSNVRSDTLSPEVRRKILEAFEQLPEKVLWKFESELSGLPKNVKIGKWLPQNDILAHPNVKLFITHSGGLSTHETVHRGVPVVAIPFLADQHINARRLEHFGGGVKLEFRDLTKETLLKAIRTVLDNPSYKENMQALSERFRDNPQTPLERGVFWSEYVIRHKGAPHLRSAALDLNAVQFLLLDVIAFLLAIPILFLMGLYCLCCRRRSRASQKIKKS